LDEPEIGQIILLSNIICLSSVKLSSLSALFNLSLRSLICELYLLARSFVDKNIFKSNFSPILFSFLETSLFNLL